MGFQPTFSGTAKIFMLLLPLLLASGGAFAQISYETAAQQRKEQRKFLKEAQKTESVYKDTHLNTEVFTFKRGKAARRRVKAREKANSNGPDQSGEPLKKWKLFGRSRDKRPKKKNTN